MGDEIVVTEMQQAQVRWIIRRGLIACVFMFASCVACETIDPQHRGYPTQGDCERWSGGLAQVCKPLESDGQD